MATCSLRAAIQESNFTPASDTITFSVVPSTLSSALPTISQPTIIDGNGSGITVIDGTDNFRIFNVSGGAVTFKDLRIQDGGITNPTGEGGAAIQTTSDLVLDNVTVTSNQITGTGDGNGAGIFSPNPPGETVTITDSTITNNMISNSASNSGAGIFSVDTLNVTDSTVSGNAITAGMGTAGGGIAALRDIDIQRSTISGNSLFSGSIFGATGGGIWAPTSAGTMTIANSTISTNTAGNAATGDGGGAYFNGPATVTNTTFEDNNAIIGGDDLHVGAPNMLTVQNTIFGSGANACNGAVVSATPGSNIDAGTSCMLGTTNGNKQADPMLGPLALNAPGTTETHALLPGSPAIDAATVGPATDQRGVARPQGTFCDIGAFELEAANDAPGCAGFPVITPPVVPLTPATPTAPAPPRKKCKKKKRRGAAAARKCKKKRK